MNKINYLEKKCTQKEREEEVAKPKPWVKPECSIREKAKLLCGDFLVFHIITIRHTNSPLLKNGFKAMNKYLL